jgi:hypothetical protein
LRLSKPQGLVQLEGVGKLGGKKKKKKKFNDLIGNQEHDLTPCTQHINYYAIVDMAAI